MGGRQRPGGSNAPLIYPAPFRPIFPGAERRLSQALLPGYNCTGEHPLLFAPLSRQLEGAILNLVCRSGWRKRAASPKAKPAVVLICAWLMNVVSNSRKRQSDYQNHPKAATALRRGNKKGRFERAISSETVNRYRPSPTARHAERQRQRAPF